MEKKEGENILMQLSTIIEFQKYEQSNVWQLMHIRKMFSFKRWRFSVTNIGVEMVRVIWCRAAPTWEICSLQDWDLYDPLN